MKNLFFLFIAVAGLFVACTKNEGIFNSSLSDATLSAGDRGGDNNRCMRGDSISLDSLPASIMEYVKTNYAGSTVVAAVKKGKGNAYAVELSTGEVLLFNAEGSFVRVCDGVTPPPPPSVGNRCMRGDSIDIATLPTTVFEYVKTNYASATIVGAVVKKEGFYGVELSSGEVLLFSADGAFIKVCDGKPVGGPGGGPGKDCMAGDTVEVSSLPAAITEFIATKFEGATIVAAVVKADGSYAVQLNNGRIFIFKADGSFAGPCGGPKGPGGPGGNGGNGGNGGPGGGHGGGKGGK